jgi:hypothetical protein
LSAGLYAAVYIDYGFKLFHTLKPKPALEGVVIGRDRFSGYYGRIFRRRALRGGERGAVLSADFNIAADYF